MKRNSIVMTNKVDMYRFYGRIVRIIDDKALWICCGLHIHLTPLKDLEHVTDYVGSPEWSTDGMKTYYHRDKDGWPDFSRVKFQRPAHLFNRMTSLRKLKQLASRYHGRNVWKTPLDYESLSD